MKFSILICTHNRSDLLKQCLDSILVAHQAYALPIQVIIVDNASTDGTDALARGFVQAQSGGPVSAQLLHEARLGKSNALMTGLRQVRGDYIVTIDDDNFLFPDTLKTLASLVERYPHHLIGSVNVPIYETTPPAWIGQMQGALACGPQEKQYEATGALCGAGLVYPTSAVKQLLEQGFGFSVSCRKGKRLSSGSDTEFCYALRIMGLGTAMPGEYRLHHFIPAERLRPMYFIRLFYWFGKSNAHLRIYRSIIAAGRPCEAGPKGKIIQESLRYLADSVKRLRFTWPWNQLETIHAFIYHLSYMVETMVNHDVIAKTNARALEVSRQSIERPATRREAG